MVITCLLLHNKRQEEKEQARQIEALYNKLVAEELQAQEHQVDVVQEPYVYEPKSDKYYDELELLAHLIYSEVGNEGEEAMYYAGSVVLNRMAHGDYPSELEDVIYQKGQYEVTWNGGLYKETPSDIAYEVAADLLEEGAVIPDNILYQSEFVQGSGVYDKIGNTYYCYK